jgi:hypothetical protein
MKMTSKIRQFLVSTGEADQEYGLYVMERDSPNHAKDALLAYYYDSDSFFPVRDQERGLFIPALELKSCKDEFGNEFSGENLLGRIEDAIKAYEKELPGYVRNVLNHPLLDDDE